MKTKLKFALLFGFVLHLSSSIYPQQNLSDAKIRELIKHEVDNGRCPGIIVGMLDKNGKEIIAAGKTNIDNGKTPDGNTLYEIGSITKVFTSLLLEEMAEKRELSVKDPISKFLPGNVKTPIKDGKEITLLDLSTQTSGLPRMPDNFAPKDWKNPFADYTPQKLYDYLSHYNLTRGIGEKYEYSNTGVGLLGYILSLKAGADYETLLRDRICKPLNMCSTVITLTPELKKRLATGYDQNGKATENWDFSALAGAGAIKSCVNDMLIFAAANLGMVKTNLANAMETIQEPRHNTDIEDLYIGMGWHIWIKFDKKIIWHNGGTGGYRTFIGLDKGNQKAVVVLSNGSNNVDDIGLHLLDSRFAIAAIKKK